jgi:twitching motility protein PilT
VQVTRANDGNKRIELYLRRGPLQARDLRVWAVLTTVWVDETAHTRKQPLDRRRSGRLGPPGAASEAPPSPAHSAVQPGPGEVQAEAARADANTMFDIDAALTRVIEMDGSDLHLKVPSRPIIRCHGILAPIADSEPLSPEDTERTFFHMLTDETKLESFRSEHEVDFSYSIPGVARFRVNAFVQRGSISIVCRAIPYQVRTAKELLLPPVIDEIADEERGLILLTGTTGSGKSTTLAAMINHINTAYAKHIVTIEDPVEYLHRDKQSIINQREVGEDTTSFSRALRRVLRQDPDVILIGEMRDEETVRTALSAAETGHLVLSTIHTVDAAESVNRIIDFFPEGEQRQARAMLAGTLKAVVSQRLVPSPHRNGRVATCEILRMTGRVRDMIMNPDETGRLPEAIYEGAYYGMQTFDQALLAHVQAGRVAMDDALKAATHPHDFKLLVSSDGQRHTSVEAVFGTDDAEAERALSAVPETPAA